MLRPWELNFEISRQSGTPIHVQIAQKIIAEIQSGRFSAGLALPGTRDLATKIQVNRKTVIQAYDELISQGWLTSESKRGTFVATNITTKLLSAGAQLSDAYNSQRATANSAIRKQLFAHQTANVYPSNHYIAHKSSFPSSDTIPLHQKKQRLVFIHFNDGQPDARLMPLEAISRAMRHALIVAARNNTLGQTEAQGSFFLREALANMLNLERGLYASAKNICLFSSSQMAIYVIAKVLLQNGGNVVMEEMSNPLAYEAFDECGADILHVRHDEHGLDTDHLEKICQQIKIKAVYVSPQHQIPTTACLSSERRKKLLSLADQYHFLIIEDDQQYEFNYDAIKLPLASQQPATQTIYVGSMSKVLSAGIRVAYIVATDEVIQACAEYSLLIDYQCNQMSELAIAELLHTGEIKRHILRAHKIYEARRLHTADLVSSELVEYVQFKPCASGLAFWLEIKHDINMQQLVKDVESHKIRFSAGTLFAGSDDQPSGIRLGFASLNDDEMQLGIARLKAVFELQKRTLKSA